MNRDGHSSPVIHNVEGKTHKLLEKLKIFFLFFYVLFQVRFTVKQFRGGGDTVRFCPIFTLFISLTAGFTSPFPHLFSIVRENKCLVRSGYEFVTILHLGSR